MKSSTYILRCADNKLYVGSTTNIEERLKRHNAGYASEFTHLHRPVELVYKEDYDTYQEAFKRKRQLKKWSLAKKEALIAGDIEKLKELSKYYPYLCAQR
jgi:putative endonuclease